MRELIERLKAAETGSRERRDAAKALSEYAIALANSLMEALEAEGK